VAEEQLDAYGLDGNGRAELRIAMDDAIDRIEAAVRRSVDAGDPNVTAPAPNPSSRQAAHPYLRQSCLSGQCHRTRVDDLGALIESHIGLAAETERTGLELDLAFEVM
jgi:hypothetical protein